MNLHFPLPKIRTIGDELTLSLAKIRTFRFSLHTSRLSLHREVTIVALKIRIESTRALSIAKHFFALFVLPLSNGTSRDEWSKTQDKRPNPTQSHFVLHIEKMNQINTKNYWK